MKTFILLLAVTSVTLAGETDAEFALRMAILRQQMISANQAQLEPRPMPLPLPVYSAYPNNPVLYRYLERNPRYIPLYLGK